MKTLLLIDANALIHRSFHALPPLTTPKGEPIGAVYGLTSTLLKILREQQPDYIAAAFDRPEPTFRKEAFKEYKAQRPKAPDELISQIIKAHEVFEKFTIPLFEKPGYEADDIIATFVKKFSDRKDLKIVILTGDLDTLQLVEDDKVVVETPKKGISEITIYNENAIEERYGLKPTQMPDYKGLVGDPSDNIPGVHGIGPKTAAKLLNEFSDLETLYKNIKPGDPLTQKLLTQKEQAFFAKKLTTLDRDVPIEVNLENLVYSGLDIDRLVPYFTELGFQSLIDRVLKSSREKSGGLKEVQSLFGNAEAPDTKEVFFLPDAQLLIRNPKLALSSRLKVAHNWKEIIKELNNHGIEVKPPWFDLEIAGWLLDPDQTDFSFEALVRRFLRKEPENFEEKAQELFLLFSQKIKEYELTKVFQEIEMPLVPILAEMETWGIGVSTKKLKELKKNTEQELEALATKIYQAADTTFNINSPQQVAAMLFEKLHIANDKKKRTATGKRSTAETVLVALKDKHPIVPLILEYRESFKIKSAFVEPLLNLVSGDGRIRTTFLQTGTATGRLSSEKPNLQNIPQESKWAGPLRDCFETEGGFSFLALDYSQLELRILAHVSQDLNLLEVFKKNLDIHALTAARILAVPLEKVSPPMRRLGKTLNFGVMYGMGTRAFAEVSGVTPQKAKEFIDEYFGKFPAVKRWQEEIKREVQTFGYVKNQNGRRRLFLGLSGEQGNALGEMERAAINMPIQSLEADILKLATIKTRAELVGLGLLDLKVKLLLNIHDELLFEIRDDILKDVTPLLKKIMENIYELSVPLVVEVKSGKNWGSLQKLEL